MFKFKNIYLIAFIFVALVACQSVSNRIDEKTMLEEKELSKWLNKKETDLKIFYGQPEILIALINKIIIKFLKDQILVLERVIMQKLRTQYFSLLYLRKM